MGYTGLIEVMIENDRGTKKISWEETNFSPGRGASQLSLGKVSLGLLQRGCISSKGLAERIS